MYEAIDQIGDRFINAINQELEKTDNIDMRVLSAKFTSDVIGNVAFGLECRCKIKFQTQVSNYKKIL